MQFDNRTEVRRTYRKRAKHYDFTASLYNLIGFRIHHYRRQAVNAVQLQSGDTVVEIGCGTGLNFPLLEALEAKVGTQGKIIGVDLTDAMLEQARQRVNKHGWANVELIQQDATTFDFPSGIDGIISSFALSLVPELDVIIHNGYKALKPDKRLAILDLKMPSNWLAKLWPLVKPTVEPFAVTDELVARKPWLLMREAMESRFDNMEWRDLYLGFAYIALGTR